MIINTKALSELCNTVRSAVEDKSKTIPGTGTVELVNANNKLIMRYAFTEYKIEASAPCTTETDFDVFVRADKFCGLSTFFSADDTSIVYDGVKLKLTNGNIKLTVEISSTPIYMFGDTYLSTSPTEDFTISEANMKTIMQTAFREYNKNKDSDKAKYLCLSNDCVVAKSGGACVTKMNLSVKSDILINSKFEKLLKLLSGDVAVKCYQVPETSELTQTIIVFTADDVEITLKLGDLSKIPSFKEKIVEVVSRTYPHTYTLKKSELLSIINLSKAVDTDVVSDPKKNVLNYEFTKDSVNISSMKNTMQTNMYCVNSNAPDDDTNYKVALMNPYVQTSLEQLSSDTVTIGLGGAIGVKIYCDDVTTILIPSSTFSN